MSSSQMQLYAATLQASIKEAGCKAAFAEPTVCKAAAWRERLTPLDVRLEKILSEIPSDVQAEGLSLRNLQRFLKGRWRGNAHPGELGTALRHLGWHRTRKWRGDEIGFRARWYPASKSI